MGTTTSETTLSDQQAPPAVSVEATPTAPPSAVNNILSGNPATVGIPAVIAGATVLGILNAGWIDVSGGAGLPIYMGSTVLGLLIATLWSCALGQNAAASVYGVFLGFYASYAALVLGLTHKWYGLPAEEVTGTVKLWLVAWLVTIAILTLVTLRLPFAFTLLLVIVDIALIVLLVATINGSTSLTHVGGYLVFAFVAVAVYLYVDAMLRETGGNGLPLGKPVIGG